MRIEAPNLQEAFAKAAQELNCSVTELEIKVLQHPRSGILGLFKKPAIIEANVENTQKFEKHKKQENKKKEQSSHHNTDSQNKDNAQEHKPKKNRQKKKDHKQPASTETGDFDNFFKDESESLSIDETPKSIAQPPKESSEIKQAPAKARHKQRAILDNSIIDTFNKIDKNDETKPALNSQLLNEIKQKLEILFGVSDFEVDSIEVLAYNDETIEVRLDGADAALLIGKEGHRYKALSYILFNWINLKYGYALRLEIAQFLKTQEESTKQYVSYLSQKVHENGRVQSRPLDGVLLKITLDSLRAEFTNKYVGVKNTPEGKCVVVNDFHRK